MDMTNTANAKSPRPTKQQRELMRAIEAGREVDQRRAFHNCVNAGWITFDRGRSDLENIRLTDKGRAALA